MSLEPRSALEQILFAAETGMTPDAIRAWWPPNTPWRERERSILAPSSAISPFGYVEYMLMAGVLYNVKLVTVRQGDYAAFAGLEAELRAQLTSIAAWTDTMGRPFSLEAARPRLEGKGNARLMMAVPIGGDVPGVGVLSGKALAFNRDGAQHYGFELFWRYGGYPA